MTRRIGPREVGAQRRPGHQPRRHSAPRRWRHCRAALNEGRGINPGDTSGVPFTGSSAPSAQRRPGHQPRRHLVCLGGGVGDPLRSTKAGASTPATRTTVVPDHSAPCSLNEGRGINPGDTWTEHLDAAFPHERSTKAGASTPATRRSRSAAGRRHTSALNEGRGINPGDTPRYPAIWTPPSTQGFYPSWKGEIRRSLLACGWNCASTCRVLTGTGTKTRGDEPTADLYSASELETSVSGPP